MYAYRLLWGGLCACVWKLHVKPEISVPNLPQSFSSLFSESGSLNKTQSSPTWLVSLACWSWGSPVSSFPGITDRSLRLPHTHVGSGGLDSGPYSCATNILTTKLSFSFQLEFLWLLIVSLLINSIAQENTYKYTHTYINWNTCILIGRHFWITFTCHLLKTSK